MAESNVLEEHFWFTTTAFVVNGFVVSTDIDKAFTDYAWWCATLISACAIFLIIDRSGPWKNHPPKWWRSSDNKLLNQIYHTGWRLWKWTCCLLFVIVELSGSLFYIGVIFLSWLAAHMRLTQ